MVNYYYNAGSYGPTYAISILSFLISVAIVPPKQYWLWLPLNIGLILGLLYIEG